jgi:hypothetical protein
MRPPLDQDFYSQAPSPYVSLFIKPGQIPKCAEALPRLQGRSWYLTKQVCTFGPEEMHDLEFQSAVPILQATLPVPEGRLAARMLTGYGASAVPIIAAACKSANPTERINAASALQWLADPRLVEAHLALFNDEVAQVRFFAVMAATPSAPRFTDAFTDALIGRFRDPVSRIRWQASQWLLLQEPASRAPAYVSLLRDPDPNVQYCAFRVLSHMEPDAIPRACLLGLLSNPQFEVIAEALDFLEGGVSKSEMVNRPAFPGFHSSKEALSSAEAAPLTTNRFTIARLVGLKVLRNNADAQAIELALPLLKDTNSLVRNRAFALMQAVSDQDIPQNDFAKWEQWWVESKAAFSPRQPSR